MNRTNEPCNYLEEKHFRPRENSKCKGPEVRTITVWGSRKRKWTSVAKEEDEKTNTGGRGSGIRETEEPDLETMLRSLDFILSGR